ncbi:MAG: group I intron-associated PD-(D/E)XK endonuclease [Acidobacteriota bacterium]|nr:group I intron-associated PD-(D/E)XK endonuclease [Acidobacteriota bacterium]
MNNKQNGNIAMAKAIHYFLSEGFNVFLPLGDCGGDIDFIITKNGVEMFRVQCKSTYNRHTSMSLKRPDLFIYEVSMLLCKTREDKRTSPKRYYTSESFDFVYVVTPHNDYLIDWKEVCANRANPPSTLILGSKLDKYRLFKPEVAC